MNSALALCMACGLAAASTSLAPFLPAPAPPQKIVKMLAPADFIDRAAIEAFENSAGWIVALDSYSSAAELAERGAGEAYDVVLLRGPALARRLVAGGLARLDRSRLPNSRRVNPIVAAKYGAYDREAAHGVPYGWTAFGLIYDADKFASPPASFAQALGLARDAHGANGCGAIWPDAREESFLVAWKLAGVDPARARPADVKSASAVLEKARAAFQVFAVVDEVGALAKGAACLGAGTAGEAAAAMARGGDNAPTIRYAYPREGAPLAIYAFAIPANATAPEAAYRLIDALLEPEAAKADANKAGVNSALEASDLEMLKRLTPEPTLDAALMSAMQAEWKRLTSAK